MKAFVKRCSVSGLTGCVENYTHGSCGALFEYWVMGHIVARDRIIGDFFDKFFLHVLIHDIVVLFT